MPITRSSKMDRRRRVLREYAEHQQAGEKSVQSIEQPAQKKAGAGYSQDVRQACGQRLVQLIPVRLRSYWAVLGVSFLVPGLLICLHYWVYVNAWLPWHTHPLARSLDAGHQQSIAAWLGSQLWLLCLASTVLIFQLRRHKLDDYSGEYRLWFWMVVTCVLASIDATTHIIDGFGLALNHWTTSNLGWSGPAVVKATASVLIGMLGVRLCSELKVVPLSLGFWLAGLAGWATSAALSQPEFQLNISIQVRYWLVASSWLMGLTCVWLASVTYLRTVYIEAQRRFLVRNRHIAASTLPIRERIRNALPNAPTLPQMPNLASFRLGRSDKKQVETDEDKSPRSRRKASKTSGKQQADTNNPTSPDSTELATQSPSDESVETSSRFGIPKFFSKRSRPAEDANSDNAEATSTPNEKSTATPAEDQTTRTRNWMGWLGNAVQLDDDADEYRKVTEEDRAAAKAERERRRQERQNAKAAKRDAVEKTRQEKRAKSQENSEELGEKEANTSEKKSWRPQLPKLQMPSIPKLKVPKFKLPKLGLGGLALKPPSDEGTDYQETNNSKQEADPRNDSQDIDFEEIDSEDNKQLTKAERKRLRRQQQRARRAA